MAKCTINGKELEVRDGTTIIEAMHVNHQSIAHYCWHPGLSVAGVCRLCMVEIEGNPRLQIACNTTVTEGMKINNTSGKVKDAVKWGLDFHLINHPLDCPICDQAGECGLQDQYMEYGQYDSDMAERKVKKHKVVDLGERVVLDSERCILCSRCVRFTDEVTKTKELGIFSRGDHSEVGTFADRPLNNKYSTNVVDICPVGALTSKDFRFKQRVWYLKDANSICTGCSTGCNIKVYYNREGVFRIKPVPNAEVNGYWMCDNGRDIYKNLNLENRLKKAKRRNGAHWQESEAGALAKELALEHKAKMSNASLVLTGQYTNEELESILVSFINEHKSTKIYHWMNQEEKANEFDGLLIRGDKNPNTQGLKKLFAKYQIKTEWADLQKELKAGQVSCLVVAGPENLAVFPELKRDLTQFSQAKNLIYLTAELNEVIENLLGTVVLVPMKTFIEKSGTFTNYSEREQKIQRITTIVPGALTLSEFATLFAGKELAIETGIPFVEINKPLQKVAYESRKKNEFTYRQEK